MYIYIWLKAYFGLKAVYGLKPFGFGHFRPRAFMD